MGTDTSFRADVSPEASDAAAVACALIGKAYGGEVKEVEGAAAELLGVSARLSEHDWLEVRRFSANLEPRDRNLDQTEYLLEVLRKSAELTESVALKMRLLGLGSCSPAPPPSEIGMWWPQADLWWQEIALVRDTDWGVRPEDWRHLSDYGKSAAAASPYPTQPPGVEANILDRLWLPRVAPGRVMNSMTPIPLLLRGDAIAEEVNAALIATGAILNPRLIHLFCDDGNNIPYYWSEEHPWETVIETWKEYVNEICLIWIPGENDRLLVNQFERSTNWANYSDPSEAEMMQSDQPMFDELRTFLNAQ